MNTELLSLKHISPLQKLIIQLVLDTPDFSVKWSGGLSMTSYEMSKALGVKQAEIHDELWNLQELDYIHCKVNKPYRITTTTNRLNKLLKQAKNASDGTTDKQLLTA